MSGSFIPLLPNPIVLGLALGFCRQPRAHKTYYVKFLSLEGGFCSKFMASIEGHFQKNAFILIIYHLLFFSRPIVCRGDHV
jgi:hypothetical protein